VGHQDAIRDIKFCNQKYLLSAGSDEKIKLWNFPQSKCFQNFSGHTNTVWSLAISSSSSPSVLDHPSPASSSIPFSQFVSAAADSLIKQWDIETGNCLQTIKGHEDGVFTIEYGYNVNYPHQQDERLIISGSNDRKIIKWDLRDGKKICTMRGHLDAVCKLKVNPKYVISSSGDGTVKVWNNETNRLLQILIGHKDWIWSLALHRKLIITGSDDSTIKFWKWDPWVMDEPISSLRTCADHSSGIAAIECNAFQLISGDNSGVIKIRTFHEEKIK